MFSSPFQPSAADHAEFAEKVLPIVHELVAEGGLAWKTRWMNLGLGILPKTKAETAFQIELLRRVAAKYPGTLYPKMCPVLPPDMTATRH